MCWSTSGGTAPSPRMSWSTGWSTRWMFGRSAWRLRRNPATFPQPMRTSRERASGSGGVLGWGLMKDLLASARGFARCCAGERGLKRDSAQRSGSARTAGAFSISHVWLRVEASTRRVRHIRRLAQVRPALSRGRPVTRSKRIRVMYVVPDLGVGGAERHVTRVMPNLDRSRFDTAVVCIGTEGKLFGDLAGSGTRAVALRRPRKRQAVRALRDLMREMRNFAPDVVITRGYSAETLGRIAAWLAHVPHNVVRVPN